MWYIHTIDYYLTVLKEESTDTFYNMNDPWKHFAKWKKPDTNGHILYDSIYVKYAE